MSVAHRAPARTLRDGTDSFSDQLMWCSTCQQDVPGVAHSLSGRTVCTRCQRPLAGKKAVDTVGVCDEGIALDDPAAAAAAATRPRFNDWRANQQVRHLERELRRSSVATSHAAGPFPHGPRRFDPPAQLFDDSQQAAAPPFTAVTPSSMTSAFSKPRRSESGQVVAWLIVVIGMLALAGGVGLIAWSLAAQQMGYWDLALGLTLGGQGGLIFGLVLVVSRLWRNSRYASRKLQEVHVRLGQLQQSADALTSTRSGGAPAFYADLVRGASPHVLLANLKGQLEQLAARVGSG